jgi:flagellar motor switch protein FliN/FliY
MDRTESPEMEKQTLDDILRRAQAPAGPPGANPRPFEEVGGEGEAAEDESRRTRADLLRGVHLKVRVELGRSRILLKDALDLGPGSIVDLEKLADEPVDLYVNDLLIARGEVLVVNDCFCVRITEVLAQGGVEEEP